MSFLSVREKKRGFTLIEVLIDMFLLSVLAATVFVAYMSSAKMAKLSRAKIAAVSLANEKFEEIRNMPYNDVATVHGPIYPAGNLADSEVVMRDGMNFILTRDIRYVDDDFDGNLSGTIVGKPKDLYPYDYKKVEITAKLVGKNGILATITSNLSGKAAETPTNTGIIRACIVDSNFVPVDQANVKILNSGVDPMVDIVVTTGNDGCIFVPNLPPDTHNGYHLEASKNGYSVDMTYERTAQNPNSLQPNINVLAQQVTSQTLSIDRLSTMTVDVTDENNSPLPNTTLHIEGTKSKWFNPTTYKYVSDIQTDANGRIVLQNMEFDDYKISIQNKIIATTSPYQPMGLKAGVDQFVNIRLAANGASMLIKSCDPIMGVKNSTVSIDINGLNINSGATVKMVSLSSNELIGQNVSVNHNLLSADFDLNNAETGDYDIIIQNPSGDSIRQIKGFTIIQ
ncbi:MAG: prepilin-type N-terminal cleavage/methylation domain-containing protein [bacterium]